MRKLSLFFIFSFNSFFAQKVNIPSLNSPGNELSPIISSDGKTIYFCRSFNGDQDIWFSEWKDTLWSFPQKAGFPLNNSGPNFVVSLSPDGNTIYLGNTYNAFGSPKGEGISVSTNQLTGWEIPKKIIVRFLENNAPTTDYYFAAGQRILIAALDNDESIGKKDLFISYLQKDGSYSKPAHMGKVLNSSGDEYGMFLSLDGKSLYFTSTGHQPNYGASDIFRSKRLDDSWLKWSKPENLGKWINTEYAENSFTLTADSKWAFFTSNEKGSSDIYKIEVPDSLAAGPVTLFHLRCIDQYSGKVVQAKVQYRTGTEEGFASCDPFNGYAVFPVNDGELKIMISSPFHHSFEKVNTISKSKGFNEVFENVYLIPYGKKLVQSIELKFNEGSSVLDNNRLDTLLAQHQLNLNKLTVKVLYQQEVNSLVSCNQLLLEKRINYLVELLMKKGFSSNRISKDEWRQTLTVKEPVKDDEEGSCRCMKLLFFEE